VVNLRVNLLKNTILVHYKIETLTLCMSIIITLLLQMNTLLPYEMIYNILIYLPEKMNASLTCTLWSKCCQQLYNENKMTNHNDLYYLKKHYNRNNINDIEEYITTITNHNCLNFIFFMHCRVPLIQYVGCQNWYFKPESLNIELLRLLMMQNCITDNVSKYESLEQLMVIFQNYYLLDSLLNFALNHKSHNISHILLSYAIVMANWHNRISKLSSHELIKEVKFLLDNNFITLNKVYKFTKNNSDVLAYLGTRTNKYRLKYLNSPYI
jgi:hypothetical protein